MVKLQIKIKNPMHEAMQNLARVLKVSPTRCHELAMQQFLNTNGFNYNTTLKCYVLDSPTNQEIQASLGRVIDETGKRSSRSKAHSGFEHLTTFAFNNDPNSSQRKAKRQ